MLYRWLALTVAGLHFVYLAYLLFGGFLAWRWPRTIAVHLVVVAWAAFTLATQAPCPLTGLQNSLRELGGQRELGTTFINTYVRGVFYPADHERLTQALVGLLILVSWLGLPARWRSARCRHGRRAVSRGRRGPS
jgi:hypothetical protein